MNRSRPYGCPGDAAAPLGPLAPDLVRSTTFAHADAESVRAVGTGERPGEFYPRYGHPAARRFESQVAAAEGADGAVSFASGMAALHAVFTAFASAGDVVAASREIYGGTSALLRDFLPRFGVTVRRFDPFDAEDVRRALAGPVRLVHVETPVNPTCRVVDLRAVAERARAAGALTSVDATFVPPPLQRPLQCGFDLVMHSATKFLGGHSDVLAGVVSGRHVHLEALEKMRRVAGGVPGPDAAWLLARSMPTLELRARAQAATAERLALHLERLRVEGAAIDRVHYSGLLDHPDHAVAKGQMQGFGSLLAIEVAGGLRGAVRCYDRLRVIARAVSLGGVESVASLPLHTSHAHASAEERRLAGIADGLIRVSVGLEPFERLAEDLAQALRP